MEFILFLFVHYDRNNHPRRLLNLCFIQIKSNSFTKSLNLIFSTLIIENNCKGCERIAGENFGYIVSFDTEFLI